ncbi:MAG TPA: hypothetical protein VGD40_21500 [Chryseosolibacter sp.]
MRTAWLIGVYTIEMECRIEDLGYSLSHVFATSESIDSFQDSPELIVFADDGLNTALDMEFTRKIFPDALIISVAANHIFLEDCLSYSDRRSGEQSVARLIHQINEREHRWDN